MSTKSTFLIEEIPESDTEIITSNAAHRTEQEQEQKGDNWDFYILSVFILLFKLILGFFATETTQSGPIIREPIELVCKFNEQSTDDDSDQYNCDSDTDEYDYDSEDSIEETHIDTANIPFTPEYYYQQFLRKFKFKPSYYSDPLPKIFKIKEITLSEWNQFVHFCDRLDYSIATDDEHSKFMYNLLNYNKNKLDWQCLYIYRSYRDKKENPSVFMKKVIQNGKENANIITLKLIRLIMNFPYIIRQNISEIFENTPTVFCDNPSEFNRFIVGFLMNDSQFYLYFRVLNWISVKTMNVLMTDCLESELKERHFKNRNYGVLPDQIFMHKYLTNFFENEIRIGWVKISNYLDSKHAFYRFFPINKDTNANELQIRHLCPLYWQKYYIGKYGLDTIMFRFDKESERVRWEHDRGILLYKQKMSLEMDGFTIGKAESGSDSDSECDNENELFHIYGLRYDGIKYRNKFNIPSFSNGKFTNMGYLYFNNKKDMIFEAVKALQTKECGQFVFVPWIIDSTHKNNDFYERLIAFLVLEHCFNEYMNESNENINSNEYRILIAEICYENEANKDKIMEDMDCLSKTEKIRKYFKPLINDRKKKIFSEAQRRGIAQIKGQKKGKGRNKPKRKRGKNERVIDRKVNAYMNEWFGQRKIKYRHYLSMVNDLGQYLDFEENIKSVRRKGSHAAIHFKKNIGAIPLIPRPHGKHGISVSLFIVKKWIKQFIAKDR